MMTRQITNISLVCILFILLMFVRMYTTQSCYFYILCISLHFVNVCLTYPYYNEHRLQDDIKKVFIRITAQIKDI